MSEQEYPIKEIVFGNDLSSILEWGQQLGYSEDEVFGTLRFISKNEKNTLEYWFKNKVSIEGLPDSGMVEEIGLSGKINCPPVIDIILRKGDSNEK